MAMAFTPILWGQSIRVGGVVTCSMDKEVKNGYKMDLNSQVNLLKV